MSYDPSERDYKIIIDNKYQKEVEEIIKNINKRNGYKLEYKMMENKISVYEPGMFKYGFTSLVDFNYTKFIEDIIMLDKENVKIIVSVDGYLENDSDVYSYKNGEIILQSLKNLEMQETKSKEEKIKLIKQDFEYFVKLTKGERKDFDYQMASLEPEYPSIAWEFGSEDYDKLYSKEFLDREETVRAIFKFGGRFNLFKNRVDDKYKNNEILMRELLPLRPRYISALSDKFKEDKNLVIELIKAAKYRDKVEVSEVSPKFRNDKKVMLNFIKQSYYAIEYASKRLKADYDICKMYILCGGSELGFVDNKEILDDKVLMSKVLNGYSRDITKMSERLKEDPEILAEFVTNNVMPESSRVYHSSLKEKRKLLYDKLLKKPIKDIVKYGIENYEHFDLYFGIVPKKVLCDKEFIEYLIVKNEKKAKYLKFPIVLDKKLYEDKEFVNSLIKRKIEFTLDDEIKYEKAEIIRDFQKYIWEYEKMPENLRNDIDIIKKYVEFDGYNIRKLDKKYLENNEIRKIALENFHISRINYLEKNMTSDEIKKELYSDYKKLEYLNTITDYNRDDLLLLVKNCGGLLRFHGEKYLDDREMILKAINSYPKIYNEISDRLKNDKEIIMNGLKGDNQYLYSILSDEIKQDDEITKQAIKISCYNIKYAPEKYKNDEKLLKKYLSRFICMRENLNLYIGDKLKDNEEFMLYLCKMRIKRDEYYEYNCKQYFKIASERLCKNPEFLRKVFGFKSQLTIIQTYIKILHHRNKHGAAVIDKYEVPTFSFLMNDMDYLKELAVKYEIINDTKEYSNYNNIEDLTLRIYNDCRFSRSVFLTDDLMKNKNFVIKLLENHPEYVDGGIYSYNKSKDRIINNFENDKEVMKLYKVEELLEKERLRNEKWKEENSEDMDEESYEENEYEEDIDVDSFPYDDSDVTLEDLKVPVENNEDEDFDSDFESFDFSEEDFSIDDIFLS